MVARFPEPQITTTGLSVGISGKFPSMKILASEICLFPEIMVSSNSEGSPGLGAN